MSTERPDPQAFDAQLQAAARSGDAGHFDELRARLTGAGPAPFSSAWQRFFAAGGAAQWAELPHRAERVRRRIHEDGATHNIHGRDGEAARDWPLELLPLLVGSEDWLQIEAGVLQRARLLNQVLADAYGERSLLARGLLPPSLVLAHPQYLRPMQGCRPPGGVFLHVLAVDLARGPDGGWWVVGQRCQAPSGLGYLLENRLIVAQQFPEAFRELRIQRLAGAPQAMLQGLMRLSPAGERSHVALLTPGPLHETYFEQAFLARYLGLSLVEASDLTVRGDQLFLKTLQGLERIHVLLRRVDDEYLDPLELRADSTLGVPGLLQALRAGELVMANAPGAGWLESPGLSAFWPGVCEALLGEPLKLPAVTSWWCGEASVWREHRGQLADYVLAPSFPASDCTQSFMPQLLAGLSPAELEQVARDVEADPAAHTLLARLRPSQTPVWRSGALEPRPAVLRVYAMTDGRGGWSLLSGGLARVASRGEGGADAWLSMREGSASADCWVQTEGPVDRSPLVQQPLSAAELGQSQRRVSSHAAENLFWLGRYTERAENAVRLARLSLETLAAIQRSVAPAELQIMLGELCAQQGLLPAGVNASSALELERQLISSLGDLQGAHSVAWSLQALRQCGQALRERLSAEHWQLIHEVGEHFGEHLSTVLASGSAEPLADVLGLLGRAATHLAAITGAQTDRMTRDDGWRLLSVGRQIERLDFLAGALDLGLAHGLHRQDEGFALLLGLFDSTITYRARFQARLELLPLVQLLVLDTENPRSLAWVARTLRDRLLKLSRQEARWAEVALAALPQPGQWRLEALAQLDDQGRPASLARLLRDCGSEARALSSAIGRRFFAHVGNDVHRVWQ
ncbi:circularly permuted type 2 ATP-grasp protein [Pelomonas sp. SE-A7]|uniref:circularly permuted type 2 ATP-grasp protein n=1 Tax=Pelomonas sp. SE-A7 TaxID=3054953 RepID=UPI00259C6A3E|nr:circularly permuted type 2 ATP-grasp protein [Pelomonas sp. SE-A7]MDM4766629.1 circularly permuted type 2 ATP-grasp protein [Pelomonas sp. SE-A7]